MKRWPIYIFVIASLIEILSPLFYWENQFSAKPLILLSLMSYYLLNTSMRSVVFLAALFFCWVGDIFLLFQSKNELFFMAGLGAFLIGHLFYILSYLQFRLEDTHSELLGPQKVRFSLPIILAGTGLITILYPSLGSLRIPVMIYALILTLMVLTALFRFGRTSKISFAFIFFGAILFMISDSMLAINKFLNPLPWASSWIMATYSLAQYLIVKGALAHEKINH